VDGREGSRGWEVRDGEDRGEGEMKMVK